MVPIDNAKDIFDEIEEVIQSFNYVGEKVWGNPSGYNHLSDVYEIEYNKFKIWISTILWHQAGTSHVNRYGIITTIPEIKNSTLGQIFEINLPIEFSKLFNTRVYMDNDNIEIRNYGKFTIGRRGLKREVFFNYLRDNGYEDEIKCDEDMKEYISIFNFNKGELEKKYAGKQLIKYTKIIKEFKDYFREVYNGN